MAWDADRPVPWQRLIREWFIYVGIMAIVFLVFFQERNLAGIIGGLLASGPMYLAFGFVMAKLGYRRRSLKELRSESAKPARKADAPSSSARSRPAPTKRTGSGNPQQRPSKRRR